MEIPIQNIYYMLCYSWDKLKEKDVVDVSGLNSTKLVNLFAKVLLEGVKHQLKRGLDRGYVTQHDEIRGIKGKIDFTSSIQSLSFQQAKAFCTYDELEYNVLHNQIIKTTLHLLTRTKGLDAILKDEMIGLYRLLREIETISITKHHFNQVVIHRNNRFYEFLILVCEIIYDHLLPDEEPGKMKFKDFLQDEKMMPYVFENFIRNFYKHEQTDYKVLRENIKWNAEAEQQEDLDYLPQMQTDITLRSPTRNLIIDTKFYKNTFLYNFGKPKIHSKDLYQLSSYLSNVQTQEEPGYPKWEGMLLYPTVQQSVTLSYNFHRHPLCIKTINLNQDWELIHRDLLLMIA
ncbi:5-methylcytosine-specific restriction endonuclease system specificity protein McrC [Alkalihalobacterium alkalinitrilicum]|uniref:5-methylcytosine-specific restriction endonuclease system specificity protein McrC n=1 Tax=Alkalihalobacterium alkalinitrilicum TaxID=427920 RepID=UPI000995D780|nr:5-methylcytosine-specific restriction endonuclease system specificity protein McrC [Alkalihalobacterium alkalinitrilicum]